MELIKVKKITGNDMRKKLGVEDLEIINLVRDYQERLPIFNDIGEGCCVNAKDLHVQLGVGRDFSTWIKERIKKYDFLEGVDFIKFWEKDGKIYDDTQSGDVNLDINNPNQMVRNGYNLEYCLTMDMAKQLAMVQNNEMGKIARKYFIAMEKVLRLKFEWGQVRSPEKELYKEMCKELELFYLRTKGRKPNSYVYSNEADTLNVICLGAKAKDIKEYIEAQDENTRNWLTKEYNQYLCKIQELNILYLKMNFEKDRRYEILKQGFKALYPNASFLVPTKEIN